MMVTLGQLTELLGWALLLNLGFLTIAALLLMVMGATVSAMHARMFGLSAADLPLVYFKYLAHYKTLIFVFFIGI